MVSKELWEKFKDEITKCGFSERRLDDPTRDMKRSDDIFLMGYIEDWIAGKYPDINLEGCDYESAVDLTRMYLEDNVKPQLTDEDGCPEWYDETKDIWFDAMEYAIIFSKYVDFIEMERFNREDKTC